MTQAYTQRFTEVHENVGFSVDTFAIGVHTAQAYRSMANHQRSVLIMLVGELGQGATVDLQMWQAQDAAGTGAKVIPGKAITQLTQAGGDDNSAVIIEVRTEELDVDGGFSYVNAILTVAGGTAEVGAIGLFGCSNYSPVATTAWTEIVD